MVQVISLFGGAHASREPMNSEKKTILHVFDEHVFGAMRSELDLAIRGNAPNLAALGLVSYTEFLGGLATGQLAREGCSAANFSAFLPYLGSEYEHLANQGVDIYDVVRCGLVHEYFIKGDSTIWPQASAPCGIIASAGGPTYFIVSVYRDHLFKGARSLRDEILEDQEACNRASASLERVGVFLQ